MNRSTDVVDDDTTPVGEALVVIGASAGGVEALSAVVASMPAGFRAPVVVAQHLDPRRQSRLAEILQRHTSLPVKPIVRSAHLDSGTIYVVPSNRQVQIADRSVSVQTGKPDGHTPSIDHLFITAARAYGDRLIAVVLSGNGSDGAQGAQRVKEAGGTVVIQNPKTASHPSMPASLPPTLVDAMADADEIGPLLAELLAGPEVAEPYDEHLLGKLLDSLRAESGIDFSGYKRGTILRRIQRRVLATRSRSFRDYVRLVRSTPAEQQRLAASFLIKVTEFFRDPELARELQRRILPEIIEHAKATGEIRIWSAGCATGEEAYSVAMLLADLLPEASGITARIFATDIDGEAIAFARRGIYPAASLEKVPVDLRTRYFAQVDGAYEARERVRGLVVFGQHDLGDRAPFPRIDLVLCRNVLIYFTPELQRRALQLFAFSVRQRGYLVLGKAETASPLPDAFEPVDSALKIYRREPVVVPIPQRRSTPSSLLGSVRQLTSSDRRRSPATRSSAFASHQPVHAERLLLHLPFGVVVVNRRYDIESINTAARNLLSIHTRGIGEDLVHLARALPSPEFRSLIDAALRGERRTQRFEVSALPGDPAEKIVLEISTFPESDPDSQDVESVAVVVSDVTAALSERDSLVAQASEGREQVRSLEERLRVLTDAVAQLREANTELTTANAELRSENEDLLVGTEEIQAASEEVETLN